MSHLNKGKSKYQDLFDYNDFALPFIVEALDLKPIVTKQEVGRRDVRFAKWFDQSGNLYFYTIIKDKNGYH